MTPTTSFFKTASHFEMQSFLHGLLQTDDWLQGTSLRFFDDFHDGEEIQQGILVLNALSEFRSERILLAVEQTDPSPTGKKKSALKLPFTMNNLSRLLHLLSIWNRLVDAFPFSKLPFTESDFDFFQKNILLWIDFERVLHSRMAFLNRQKDFAFTELFSHIQHIFFQKNSSLAPLADSINFIHISSCFSLHEEESFIDEQVWALLNAFVFEKLTEQYPQDGILTSEMAIVFWESVRRILSSYPFIDELKKGIHPANKDALLQNLREDDFQNAVQDIQLHEAIQQITDLI